MIALTIRLVLRSTRWVAPFIVVALWMIITLGGSSDSLPNIGLALPAFFIWGLWVALIAGNVDDDPHRDLLVAAVGSPRRLHALRAVSALSMSVPLVAAVTTVVVLTGTTPRSTPSIVAISLSIFISATFAGVGFGTFLHEPVLRHRGAATILSILASVLFVGLPPIPAVMRILNEGDTGTVLPMLGASIIWGLSAIAVASHLSTARSR